MNRHAIILPDPPNADALGPEERAACLGLIAGLAAVGWPVELRLNRNQRVFISLRGSRRGGMRLSLHQDLLRYSAALADLPRWVAAGGHTPSPPIRSALDDLGRNLRQDRLAAGEPLALEPLAGRLDLHAAFARIHGTHFGHISRPAVDWGRGRRLAPRRHVRFATYRRRPSPLVLVNPRLDQPWVARLFVDFVLFHELCHHAQACAPVRGENAHSPRFRAWERTFPGFADATRWERENLDRFLRA
jgi:hypothetical protein